MSEQQFKPGDIVRLKSGSPAMTVRNAPMRTEFRDAQEMTVPCVWYSPADLKFKVELFPATALVPSKTDEEMQREKEEQRDAAARAAAQEDEAQRADAARAAGEANEAINAGRGRW